MHIPGERDYAPSVDLVWDPASGWSAASLRQCVAQFYALPAEKTGIAKHLAEKSQWLPISSWVTCGPPCPEGPLPLRSQEGGSSGASAVIHDTWFVSRTSNWPGGKRSSSRRVCRGRLTS